MAKIERKEVINEVIKELRLSPSAGNVPTEVSDKIVAVIDAKPEIVCDVYAVSYAVNATSGTVYTTPTDKDFYLTTVSLSMIKDATSTSTYSDVQAVPFGQSGAGSIITLVGLTLTAQNQSVTLSFPIPLKLARGSIVNIRNGTNVANISTWAAITGYTKEALQ